MTSQWTSPSDIRARLQRLWDRGEILRAHLSDEPIFPLSFNVKRPSSKVFGSEFSEVRQWIAELKADSKEEKGYGFELEWEEVNLRQVGKNRIPRRVVVPTEQDALAILRLRTQAARWDALIGQTLEAFPQLESWIRKRPLKLLELAEDWEGVLSVLEWFSRNPRSALYLRQVDVPGVDTKFIEGRRSLLGELLEFVLDADCINPTSTKGVKTFERRFGLRSKPLRLRVRSLDPALHFSGLTDVEAPISEWADQALPVGRLILTENETNFLAFPPMPGSAIAFTAGYSIDRVARIPWLRDRLVFYWGDIDTHGFGILDLLRKWIPKARSFLMDHETLLTHRSLWVEEPDPRADALERLTTDESELYEDLVSDQFGRNVRLEQERVSFSHVQQAIAWIEETSKRCFPAPTELGLAISAQQHFEEEAEQWIEAAGVRNWVLGDPLLDWLDQHGKEAGFSRDDELPTYDERLDFSRFIGERGRAFLRAVVSHVERQCTVLVVPPHDSASEWAAATAAALQAGAPVISNGLLADARRRSFSRPELLVRADMFHELFPETMLPGHPAGDSAQGSPDAIRYHPVLVRFRSFDLTVDGHVSTASGQLLHAVEAWFHGSALGAIQGQSPTAAYLLGRSAFRAERGLGSGSAIERLARVDMDRWLPQRECYLGDVARSAAGWQRRLAVHGAGWTVLPCPSVPELYPHARNRNDAPWHAAKRRISEQLEELTLLPGVNPARRQAAHGAGLFKWSQAEVGAATLGVDSALVGSQIEAVLAANRASAPVVVPDQIELSSHAWRRPAPVEFFVDFETVVPFGIARSSRGSRIVQVGCGHVTPSGEWQFSQWTVDSLDGGEERQLIDSWMSHMLEVARDRETELSCARVCHWSAAERVQLETALNSARERHPDSRWPDVPWFDVLHDLVRAAPIGVTGAFDFGLESITKAMQAAGFIDTAWPPGPVDGLGALVGACVAAEEAGPMSQHPVMLAIGRYNEIDCRAVRDVLTWLREHR